MEDDLPGFMAAPEGAVEAVVHFKGDQLGLLADRNHLIVFQIAAPFLMDGQHLLLVQLVAIGINQEILVF